MEVQINELKEKRRKGKTPFTQHGARQNLPIREIHEEKKKEEKKRYEGTQRNWREDKIDVSP